MYPTLKKGQDVLTLNWFINPKVGDLVVVKVGSKEMVKRISQISDCEVFVMGDNQKMSTDSRNFGPISRDQILGKVIWHQ